MRSEKATEMRTNDPGYSKYLEASESAWWKRAIDVQAPYRWNLRRLNLGHTLDIGCGLGRNLAHLGGAGVGVDHNPASVAIARARGFLAFTPDDFERSQFGGEHRFDSILLSHVAEHMREEAALNLLATYRTRLRPGGRVVLITPQERGYASDPTHVSFMDFAVLDRLTTKLGMRTVKAYSFPFPRVFGHLFRYNEFVLVAASD